MRKFLAAFIFSFLFSISALALSLNAASTSTALTNGATFTGEAVNVDKFLKDYNTVVTSVKTDQDGTLYMEFSTDGTNWDSSLSFSVIANTNEVHRLTVSKKYFRTRFTNTSASPQTYLRLQSLLTTAAPILTSSLNTAIQQDSDALTVKSVSDEFAIATGLFSGLSITNKFGTNADVDTGTVPEDIWEGGGAYTGWATAAENLMVVSTSTNDAAAGTGARTGRAICLDANYETVNVTFTLNGTTPVNTGTAVIRCHTATILTAGSGGGNAGTLSFYQQTTTSNVFLNMVIGRNQTNCSAFTVPAGYTAYMRYLHVAVQGSATAAVEGYIWTRTFGQVFRSRRPFTATSSYRLADTIYGGLVFTEKSDIILRLATSSANNVAVSGGYDLVLVKN